jgi:hypothetical protein
VLSKRLFAALAVVATLAFPMVLAADPGPGGGRGGGGHGGGGHGGFMGGGGRGGFGGGGHGGQGGIGAFGGFGSSHPGGGHPGFGRGTPSGWGGGVPRGGVPRAGHYVGPGGRWMPQPGWRGAGRFGQWRGGHWWRGNYQGRYGTWWVVGPDWYWYPPETATAAIPDPDTPPGMMAGFWYWCDSAQQYYPYVGACSEGWRQVQPQGQPPS